MKTLKDKLEGTTGTGFAGKHYEKTDKETGKGNLVASKEDLQAAKDAINTLSQLARAGKIIIAGFIGIDPADNGKMDISCVIHASNKHIDSLGQAIAENSQDAESVDALGAGLMKGKLLSMAKTDPMKALDLLMRSTKAAAA